jgi:hypothetical protein
VTRNSPACRNSSPACADSHHPVCSDNGNTVTGLPCSDEVRPDEGRVPADIGDRRLTPSSTRDVRMAQQPEPADDANTQLSNEEATGRTHVNGRRVQRTVNFDQDVLDRARPTPTLPSAPRVVHMRRMWHFLRGGYGPRRKGAREGTGPGGAEPPRGTRGKNTNESACKPDPVPGSPRVAAIHLGLPSPAGSSGLPAGIGRAALERLRRRRTRRPLGLAPGGVYRATPVTRGAGGLLHHRFTLTRPPRRPGGLFSVALSRRSPRVAVNNHPALWSPDFPRRRTRGPADAAAPPTRPRRTA